MDKNELIVKEEKLINSLDIKSLIYTIRGQQVMLDSDLAMVYGYSVKRLNEQVSRNIDKFPSDFMFKLTLEEEYNLKSQIVASSEKDDVLKSQFATSRYMSLQHGGKRKPSTAFTEQGIYMLATVLKGELATRQTIYIIRSFKQLRHMYIDNSVLLDKVIGLEIKQDNIDSKLLKFKSDSNYKFNQIFDYISEHKEIKEKIFFKGQIYDSFSLLCQLVNSADKSIVLIDNYIDVYTLNILAKKKKDVICKVYTTEKGNKLTREDIDTFNNEYQPLKINITHYFHDRFLILDNKSIYLIGASIKDAGNKTFGIIEMNKANIKRIIEELKEK